MAARYYRAAVFSPVTENLPCIIETANISDLGMLRKLEQLCFGRDAWPLLDLIAVLTFPGTIRLKAVSRGQMVGFVAGELRNQRKVGWVVTIGVHPEYRRLGIGRLLLRNCETQLGTSSVKLSVRRSNLTALRMYSEEGYTYIETWPKYYEDGEEALVLQKNR